MNEDRLKVLLYNAIVCLQDAGYYTPQICTELGMSEEEYKEVMRLDE